MWEQRCKVAVSGVGFYQVTRSAEIPLAAHALQAVRAAVDALYARILADDALRDYFADTNMTRQRAHLRAFVSQALGGPRRYAGRELRSAHARFAITDEAFDEVVGHLAAALAGRGRAGSSRSRRARRGRRRSRRSSSRRRRCTRRRRGSPAEAPRSPRRPRWRS